MTDASSKVSDAILGFFAESHFENGKLVDTQELVSIRPETVGQGSFSRVRLAEVKSLVPYLEKQDLEKQGVNLEEEGVTAKRGIFALKVYTKTEAVRLKAVERVKAEADILRVLVHPFIVKLYTTYQDEKSLYLLEEFVENGTLNTLISSQSSNGGRLSNEVARFIAAQVVMAVQCMHGSSVMYRDLNPESVMLDFRCYVKIVDFGNAKKMDFDDPQDRAWTVCGTAEYLAPEMIMSKGHSKEVDWWALGVVLHEMLAGYPPWWGREAFEVYKEILKHKVTVENLPRHFESHGKELIKKLLTKDKSLRIGSSKNGAEDIKKHKWYRGLNWAALYNRQLQPPAAIYPQLDEANYAQHSKTYVPSNEESAGPMLDATQNDQYFANF